MASRPLLPERRLLITGTSSGLGWALCRAFAREKGSVAYNVLYCERHSRFSRRSGH